MKTTIENILYRYKHILYDYPLLLAGYFFSFFAITFLWGLSPLFKIKISTLTAQRIGHLALNTDLFFRRRQLFDPPPSKILHIFVAGSVANRQLFIMWKRHMFIIENRLLRGLLHYSEALWKKTKIYESIEISGNEYKEYQKTSPTIYFTPEEEEKGKSELLKMGINPEKDWFVCIFARDAEYLKQIFSNKIFAKKDWSHHDYRNVDINSFHLAIDYLVGRGGFVIRMGHHVNQTLNYSHERVIDYALNNRSDFMDIYLSAKCKFFLGTSSGICDVPMIFNTPRIMSNAAPPYHAPNGQNCLFIPKKIKIRETGQYLPYHQFILKTPDRANRLLWYGQNFHEAGYEYENNTPEEILDITVEMMERLEGTFHQTEEDKILLENYFRLFPYDHWMYNVHTPIGRNFLRKNRQLFEKVDTKGYHYNSSSYNAENSDRQSI